MSNKQIEFRKRDHDMSSEVLRFEVFQMLAGRVVVISV